MNSSSRLCAVLSMPSGSYAAEKTEEKRHAQFCPSGLNVSWRLPNSQRTRGTLGIAARRRLLIRLTFIRKITLQTLHKDQSWPSLSRAPGINAAFLAELLNPDITVFCFSCSETKIYFSVSPRHAKVRGQTWRHLPCAQQNPRTPPRELHRRHLCSMKAMREEGSVWHRSTDRWCRAGWSRSADSQSSSHGYVGLLVNTTGANRMAADKNKCCTFTWFYTIYIDFVFFVSFFCL